MDLYTKMATGTILMTLISLVFILGSFSILYSIFFEHDYSDSQRITSNNLDINTVDQDIEDIFISEDLLDE